MDTTKGEEVMLDDEERKLEEMKRRRGELRQRVKLDVGMRGLTSKDLDGLELDTDWFEGEVRGWTMRVLLKGEREALIYTRENRDGAPIEGPSGILQEVKPS